MMDGDIQVLYNRIGTGIEVIESGVRDPAVLDAIQADFVQMLELIKLFLIAERNRYYGYFLMHLSYRAEFNRRLIAGIQLDTYPPVLCFNPLLFGRFSLPEIVFIICHEIDHVVLNHPAAMARISRERSPEWGKWFNYAADAAINDRLDFEVSTTSCGFMRMPKQLVTSDYLKQQLQLESVRPREHYLYYFNLIEDIESVSLPGPRSTYALLQPFQGTKQTSDAADDVVTADQCEDLEDHCWHSDPEADASELESVTRVFVNAVTASMNPETRGQMPAHFLEQVRSLNEPPRLNWQTLLKQYVGTIAAGRRKTRTRLNRRQPERFDLPGQMADKCLKIVVAIDTSASLDNREIQHIFNEIFEILARRKYRLTIIECDAAVRRVYTVQRRESIQLNVKGRGGTAFTPAIEYVNQDRYFRDALLVYFTDGWGEQSIPRPKTYRNLWVVLGGAENLSLKEPYGAVVSL